MKQAQRSRATLKLRCSIALLAGTALLLGACANTTAPASSSVAALSNERIAEILASPDRRAADRTNDIRRKPYDMLIFIGPRPGMVALDLSAGGGYTTELIARSVGPTGRVYGQSRPRDPNSPAPAPAAPEGAAAPAAATPQAPAPAGAPRPAGPPNPPLALAGRARNPAASNIVPVVRRFEDPVPPEVASNGLDLVTLMFNYHDLGYLGIDRAQMNRAVFAARKPGACM